MKKRKLCIRGNVWKIPLLIGVFLFIVYGRTSATVDQERLVTVKCDKVPLKEAMRQITEASGYSFFVDENEVDLSERVSVDAKDKPLKDILDQLLKSTGLTYEISNNQIVLLNVKAKNENVAGPATTVTNAQRRVIKGVVLDTSNEPVFGASVVETGTGNGTITDINGFFEIAIISNPMLDITFLGYQKQQVPVKGDNIKIVLREDLQMLDEVVITGFGLAQKKASLTGAISVVNADDISRSNSATASGALVGKIAGLNFRQSQGTPGATTALSIRNMGSPLYVIDGIPSDEGMFNQLDFNDIESVSVLKDASASIYGIRAANGVIVINTKKGRLNTRNEVSINAYYGWQQPSKFAEPADIKTYLEHYIQSETILGVTNYTYTKEDLQKWTEGKEKGYIPFDWQDFIWGTGAQSYVNANVSGGTDKVNYYFSVGHLEQESAIRNYGGFDRTNVQMNIEAQINNRLKIGASMNGRIEHSRVPAVPGTDKYALPVEATYANLPTRRPYANDNPLYPTLTSNDSWSNFAWFTEELAGYYDDKWRVAQVQGNAEYRIIDGLKLKALANYVLAYRVRDDHDYTIKLYGYDEETDTYPVIFENNNSWRDRITAHVEEIVTNVQLTYDKKLGAHTIAALVGLETKKRDYPATWIHSVPISNQLDLIDFEDVDNYTDTPKNTEARLGWLFKGNYDYANKYLLEFSARYDGSWKFAPGQRWGFFPSASVGWRMSEEAFWRDSRLKQVVNDFKIRASYGLVGDDSVSGYSAFDFMPGYNYKSGGAVIDDKYTLGTSPRGLPVTTLSWMTAKILNIGFDAYFLDNRLGIQFDFFRRLRDGLPASRYDILLPKEIGFTLPLENLNSDMNMGYDAAVLWTDKIGDVQYRIGGNITLSRYYTWEQYNPRFGNSWDEYRNSQHHRFGNLNWAYEYDGQFQSWEEIATYPIDIDGQGNRTLRPGDLKFKDLNGDNVINGYDMRPLNYVESGTPTINYGITLGAAWKGFDLAMDFSGSALSSWYPADFQIVPFYNGGNNPQYYMEDSWRLSDIWDAESELIPGKYPMLISGNSGHSNYSNCNFWKTNVRYIKLRNLEIGYTVPKKILEKVLIAGARVYLQGSNVFTISNLHGLDPETTNPRGVTYPTTRTINIGVNLKF